MGILKVKYFYPSLINLGHVPRGGPTVRILTVEAQGPGSSRECVLMLISVVVRISAHRPVLLQCRILLF